MRFKIHLSILFIHLSPSYSTTPKFLIYTTEWAKLCRYVVVKATTRPVWCVREMIGHTLLQHVENVKINTRQNRNPSWNFRYLKRIQRRNTACRVLPESAKGRGPALVSRLRQRRQHGLDDTWRGTCIISCQLARYLAQRGREQGNYKDKATRTAPLTILGHADRHPTFLVLLDAHPAPRLLDLFNLLLVQNQLPAAEPFGLDNFPVAMTMAALV